MWSGSAIPFPNVVEKQSEEQQIRPLHLRKDFGEARFPFGDAGPRGSRSGFAKPMQVLNGQERMLVHRVAVKIIADDQGIDGLELGEEPGEETQPMHVPQRRGSVRRDQNPLQVLPETWETRSGLQALQRLFHRAFGLAAQFQSVARDHLEEAQQQSRVFP